MPRIGHVMDSSFDACFDPDWRCCDTIHHLTTSCIYPGKLVDRLASMRHHPFVLLVDLVCFPGSFAGIFAAFSAPVQRHPEREVLSGRHLLL